MNVDKLLDGVVIDMCEGPCKRVTELTRTPSMTMYEWDGEGEDPNRDLMLCQECSEEYTEIMTEQWANYYRGLL